MINIMFFVNLISVIGCVMFFVKVFKIDPAFAPSAVVGFEVFLLYVTALFGVVEYTPYILCFLGIAVFLVMFFKDKYSYKTLLTIPVLFFVFMSVIVWLVSKNTVLAEYDNFSHWALAVKSLFYTGKLPTPDSLVTFYNYPPATALYCYKGVKLTQFSDGSMISAQGIAVSAFLSALFYRSDIKKPKTVIVPVIAIFCMTCVILYNLVDLYVDSIIGYCAVALICMISSKKKGVELYIPLLFTAFFVSLIKSTGILIVFIVAVYYLMKNKTDSKRDRYKTILYMAVTCVFSVGSYEIYKKIVYGNASGKTPFSFEIFLKGLSEADYFTSIGTFLHALFNFYEEYILYFYFVIILTVVVDYVLIKKDLQNKGEILNGIKSRFTAVFIWALGLWFSYTVLFNRFEMLNTASFERYFGTAVIMYTGMVAVHITENADAVFLITIKNKIKYVLLYFIPLLIIAHFQFMPPSWQPYFHYRKAEARQMMMAAKEQFKEEFDVIFDSDSDSDENDVRLYVVFDALVEDILTEPYPRYEFMSENARSFTKSVRQNGEWDREGYYLLWLDPSMDTYKYFERRFADLKMERGIYKIEEGIPVLIKPLIYEINK